MKNKINILFLMIIAAIVITSCNKEWEDEQFSQMASFKAEANNLGVTTAYVRYNAQGNVRFNLPLLISGSTPNSQNRTVNIGLDTDTLARLNQERYGHRQELYFRQLGSEYYSMPSTVEVPAGQSAVSIPIDFKLGNLDQVEKWVLPLQILKDPSNSYIANPNKQYRRAMLNVIPFNDYSGVYGGTVYFVYLDGNLNEPLTLNTHRTYVVDDKTIFLYAGVRDVDFLDRKDYKVYIKFTDDVIDDQKKKLEVWSDNAANNKFKLGATQSYYTKEEAFDDPTKPYLKRIYINLFLSYEFEDYTSIPGLRLKYKVEGTLAMQRDMNTLIPDEDQQIQW